MRIRTPRAALVALVAASVALSVPRVVAHEGECPAGAGGLTCESKDTQRHACECGGAKVKGCIRAAAGGWGRVRGSIRKLLKARKRDDRTKIRATLPKVGADLAKVGKKVGKSIDGSGGAAGCKDAAAALLDAFGARVAATFDPASGAPTTTTTLPGGGSAVQGGGSISLFAAAEITWDVSFSQPVDGFGVYVPGRSIVSSIPPGLVACAEKSWTIEGDATPNNYYECAGTLGAGVQVTGNLALAPGPVSGMPVFLYGFRSGDRFGPFTLASTF
jgi:hypothetical protein